MSAPLRLPDLPTPHESACERRLQLARWYLPRVGAVGVAVGSVAAMAPLAAHLFLSAVSPFLAKINLWTYPKFRHRVKRQVQQSAIATVFLAISLVAMKRLGMLDVPNTKRVDNTTKR